MRSGTFTLDELIDGEVETIMYSGAPQTVKAEAVKRRDQYRAQRDAARLNAPPRVSLADPRCNHCGGYGYPIFSADQTDWSLCECYPFVASERKGEAA